MTYDELLKAIADGLYLKCTGPDGSVRIQKVEGIDARGKLITSDVYKSSLKQGIPGVNSI